MTPLQFINEENPGHELVEWDAIDLIHPLEKNDDDGDGPILWYSTLPFIPKRCMYIYIYILIHGCSSMSCSPKMWCWLLAVFWVLTHPMVPGLRHGPSMSSPWHPSRSRSRAKLRVSEGQLEVVTVKVMTNEK